MYRAIKKGTGDLDGAVDEEILYEGYGPGGVAVLVETMTDNKNRTVADIRHFFAKSGGNLAETGAVSFMFDRVGLIEFPAKVASADAMLDAAIEAGAEDVVSTKAGHEIYASHDAYLEVATSLPSRSGAFVQLAVAPNCLPLVHGVRNGGLPVVVVIGCRWFRRGSVSSTFSHAASPSADFTCSSTAAIFSRCASRTAGSWLKSVSVRDTSGGTTAAASACFTKSGFLRAAFSAAAPSRRRQR